MSCKVEEFYKYYSKEQLSDVRKHSQILKSLDTKYFKEKDIKKLYHKICDYIIPNNFIFNILIQISGKIRSEKCINFIYDEMLDIQCYPNIINYNTLIKAYAQINKEDMIKLCYEEMIYYGIKPNVITYSTLIKAYDNMNFPKKVIECYQQMLADGIKPNVITYSTLIKAYDNMEEFVMAENIYLKMDENDMIPLNIINSNTIDIHGMHQCVLNTYLRLNHKRLINSKITIICGRGINSEGDPILKEVLVDFCKENNLKYKIDSQGGRICIN
jgi:pentatricopeptide repeat protein